MNKESKEVCDNVSHPFHYEGSTSIECIQAMHLAFGGAGVCYFCLCNAFKYVWRYKNKNGAEDLDKAKWYMNHANEILGRGIQNSELYTMYERMNELLDEVKNSK